MKRVLLIISSIIVSLGIAVTCIGIYFINTPEYALMKIVEDVDESGIDGLRPHLTNDAEEMVDTLSAIAENKLVSSIIEVFGKGDYADTLKSKVQWNIEDVMKGHNNAAVILAFNYENRLTGTIQLSMIRDDSGWKIDGFQFPEFDKIN